MKNNMLYNNLTTRVKIIENMAAQMEAEYCKTGDEYLLLDAAAARKKAKLLRLQTTTQHAKSANRNKQ